MRFSGFYSCRNKPKSDFSVELLAKLEEKSRIQIGLQNAGRGKKMEET